MPLTDARDNFSRLISDIENLTEGLYVLTKGGKPAIALINIKYLEEIMVGNGAETSHEATHHVSTPHHVAPKPHVSLKPVENAKPEPIVHDLPKPPAVILPDIEPPKPPLPPKPSFEVPRTTPTISNTQTPMESKSPSNYDVKPTVNPTWTGEEPKVEPLASSPSIGLGVNSQTSANPPAGGGSPADSRQPTATSPAPAALPKPPVNPWPIIPPRPSVSKDSVNTPVPPRPTLSVPSSSLSSSVGVNSSTSLGVNQPSSVPQPPPPVAPESSFPKMVAPPPPPPPSSLPRIPSSFQTVPVPVNGNKPPTTAPIVTLPPPPITTAPAPFAQAAPATPIVTPSTPLGINPKPADSIAFDQPPTTIPDPGEDLPIPPATMKTDTPAVSTTATPAATPPQSQASVQDLEI